MKKQKDGENDIVGDSQTNDAVPDDSISKEPDGEVQLGHMDSRGAPEIVSKMQQLHQSDGLLGTSSTENVPEMQQLHQSDGLSGTSSTENVPEMQQLHQSDGLSGTSSTENGLEMQQLHQSDGLLGTSSIENVLEMQLLHQTNVLLGTSSTENVPEMQQLHQSDGLSGTSLTENVSKMQQLHQSDGLSGTSSTENVSKMQQLHQSDGLSGTSSTENVPKMQQLYQSDGLSGTSSTENDASCLICAVPEMQQLHQGDGLSGISSTENVPEMQQLHQSDGLSGTSSTENVPEMQQLHQSDGLSGTSSNENVPKMQQLYQSDGLSGTSSTENIPEMQQLHQSDGLPGISSTENVLEMQQLHQSDGLSGTSSTENVPKMQQLHQSDGLSGTSSTENVPEMQRLHQSDALSGTSSTENDKQFAGNKMKKQNDGENDIVGDSQTNDTVPGDDSIWKEPDGEVQLGHMDSRGAREIGDSIWKEPAGEVQFGHMDSRGAREIVLEMQEFHQSDCLLGTLSTETKKKIMKVPAILRKVESSNNCYDPMVVAIGPYHHNEINYHHDHNEINFKRMEDIKIQFREQYASKCKKSSDELYKEMKMSLVEAKNHYTEDVEEKFKDNEEFAQMMFLDSCFVIEFMDNCVNPKKDDERITNFDLPFIMRDIMLLENQLPFNILEKLMSFNGQYIGKEMIDKFIAMIINDHRTEKEKETNKATEKSVLHLLELVQIRLVDDQKINGRALECGDSTKEEHVKITIVDDSGEVKEYKCAKKEAQSSKTCFGFHLPSFNKEIKNELSIKSSPEYEDPTKEAQRGKTYSQLHLSSSNKEIQQEYVKITIVDDNGGLKNINVLKKEAQRWKTCFGFHLPSFNKEIKNEINIESSPRKYRLVQELKSIKSSLMGWKYRSVQELKSMGIHFRPSETCQFSDITFISRHLYGWLKLPPIRIEKGTKSLLLNLVAFEACADLSSNFGVSSYVAFMDKLIDHAEDVKELRSKGIIYNLLSNDEQVAQLFNEMGESVEVVDGRIWANVQESLNAFFYNSRCSLWFTECLNNHCRSPWAVIGIVAAIVVVCLTISQTVFSAIQL
ncbi:uncharacterized protein LOC127806367 [Diospyros lotus]|uniref:uncharacterized protein LOC127806367 n=1 Tax=Diospyros lotus TaxID=55363 RepID=UPI002257DAE9|nr:uncharacterized protein LOC127806367 [Diospyros lotus]